MKQYIGTKIIEAEPAQRTSGADFFGIIVTERDEYPAGVTKREPGYRIRYPDGYESWSPKDVFEKAYLEVVTNSNLKTNAPSVSQKMVDDFIKETEVVTMGGKTTVVRAVLRNGFTVVESSSCVSPENYDERMGAEICMEHIKNKVWMLLGFLLQTAIGGVR